MRVKSDSFLLVAVLLGAAFSVDAAGFRQLSVADEGHPDINVGFWYPTDEPIASTPNTEYGLAVALEAAVGEANGGLIIISHGYSGSYAGHADTAIALADAGYVVAAPSHTGNTWSDMSSPLPKWVVDRPRHVSRVIDHALADDQLRQHIDVDKIGVYGFSAGGYTALGVVGAVPDLGHAEQHCQRNPREFVCREGMVDVMLKADLQDLPVAAWGEDDRVSAAVIAAPGLGFAYTAESLAEVDTPIQLWSAEHDHSVPHQTNSAWLATQLPQKPDLRLVENASHFAFLIMPCREEFEKADPEEYAFICGDVDGFDRHAFHDYMHGQMIEFYERHLMQ